MEGVEEFTPIIDENAQILVNTVPAFKQASYTLLSYNELKHKIIFMNAGPAGDYWIMRQDRETGTMISDPHTNPDGSVTIHRCTTLRQKPDEMDVQMESSADGGQTWTIGFRQYLTRAVND